MIAKKYINKIFYLFLFIHLVIWTLVPSFSNINLPLDTIEALAWGSNLDWGLANIHHLVHLQLNFSLKCLK